MGIMYIFLMIAGEVCYLITHKVTSENQSLINSLPIWFMILTAVFIAPIVEETVYRGVLRLFIKNDKLFIIISAIIFGLSHSIIETNITNVIFMSIPYAIVGGTLARMYVKTNNLTVNITCHAFYNIIAIILGLIIKV